ncbi:tyrosine-protein phosphatase [uncultured Nevskia sp.]|uniref:tyrosine-protein phosphatase n=1 Tax=uncultured Nevskia sp. TaxID=228950 RepID=UPI0025D11BE1|nr:tyrosine-protein phosphatase [uncultured Nevskia sp.]
MTAIEPGLRRLPLSGAVNFRDLGGYETADGRRLRWGRVFRSDSLAELGEADLALLQSLGLRTVCDLRGEPEREHKPNRALGPEVTTHAIGFMPHGGEELLAGARDGSLGPAEIETRVQDIYRRFVVEQSAIFARLLRLIADTDSLPLVFHCTSGRDRTGFATAMLLTALGVPRATIEADYAMSNDYRRDLTFQVGGIVAPEVMAALTQAHPSYLAAALSTIDQHHDSAERYLREALGLDDTTRARLEALLLE